jgi:uncharacterized metal-binding protein
MANQDQGVYILCCSGYSNLGKATHKVAVRLAQEGKGTLTCLAEVTAGVETAVSRVKNGKVIALDGCSNKCALLSLENCGDPDYAPNIWVNAEQCGLIKTSPKNDPTDEELDIIYNKVMEQYANKIEKADGGLSCC